MDFKSIKHVKYGIPTINDSKSVYKSNIVNLIQHQKLTKENCYTMLL